MTTKTTSIRLGKDLLKEIEERCKENECNRNDWIKNAIENQLEMEANADDEESEKSHADKKPYFDEHGNRFYWNYDRETWVCEMNPKNFRIISN